MITLLFQQRFKINVVMFFMTAFVYFTPMNGTTHELDHSLVEVPLLDVVGDYDLDESEVLNVESNSSSFRVEEPKDKCSDYLSNVLFSKKEDVNLHPGFPRVPITPIIGDQLNVSFFKEKSTGKYLVERWPNDRFPVATFHLSSKSEKYRKQIQNAFDYINRRAIEENLISKNQEFISLSHHEIFPEQEICGSNVIHVIEHKKYFSGFTETSVDDRHVEHLGQILNKDIFINVPDFESWARDFPRESAIKAYRYQFAHEMLHELMHGLGLVHNFALGSLMDYEGQSYENRFQSISKKLYRNYDQSLRYEMESLKFLYSDTYQKSKINWPLIRSTKVGTFYYSDDEPVVWEFSDKKYTANLDTKNSKFNCKYSDGETRDMISYLSRKFSISIDEPQEGLASEPFSEPIWMNVRLEDMLSSGQKDAFDSGLIIHIFDRILPVLHQVEAKGRWINSSTNEKTNLDVRQITLKRNQQFLSGFSKDLKSTLRANFTDRFQELKCDLQIEFKIED